MVAFLTVTTRKASRIVPFDRLTLSLSKGTMREAFHN